MRARLIILVVAILAVAGFAAMNWSEFLRTTPLAFGVIVADAPLGLIMLGLLGLVLLAFLISSASHETRSLIETRQHVKEMQVQRDLADKAEASRFTDLRQHMDNLLRENRQREAITAAEFEKVVVANQRELRAQLEQMNRMLVARLGDSDGPTRVEGRADQVRPGSGTVVL